MSALSMDLRDSSKVQISCLDFKNPDDVEKLEMEDNNRIGYCPSNLFYIGACVWRFHHVEMFLIYTQV